MYCSEAKVEVRYGETDQMGVVYHANYIIYMEVGRVQLMKDLGFVYADLEDIGYVSPVMDLQVSYKAALRYGQTVTVRTWIEKHERVRTTYGYEILHEDGTVAATATSVHALVTKDGLRPVALRKVAPEWDAAYVKAAKQ
ncbi:acyl-CoA thioesterase [Metalysinibacillus jejuensis]|uniref:acyl-CoA thioesterase n=1 Tax=Metalysinibacillus jejuensis TaxID=914327 RepID=UPI000D3478CF|nr:thioesterase family protein [Metalysinibacillus jejuensis]